MDQRIPAAVRSILERYLDLIDAHLPGSMRASYVVGSIALAGFNERFSDIDFIIVFERPVSKTEFEALETIHKTIERDFPKSKLSGSYLQHSDLGQFDTDVQPQPILSG